MPIPTPEQFASYESTPSQLLAAIESLSEVSMKYRPVEEEWSIHEVIIHLADSEAMGFYRLRKTIAEEGSTLQVYDEGAWAKNLSYQSQDIPLASTLFAALRASSIALLRSLPVETWERTSMHAENGIMSLYDIFIVYLQHGNVHLQQIERLKQFFSTHA